jgi:hypothetical protein
MVMAAVFAHSTNRVGRDGLEQLRVHARRIPEQRSGHWFQPTPVGVDAKRIPHVGPYPDAYDFHIFERNFLGRDRDRSAPHPALLAGDHFTLQFDGFLFVGIEDDTISNFADRANRPKSARCAPSRACRFRRLGPLRDYELEYKMMLPAVPRQAS